MSVDAEMEKMWQEVALSYFKLVLAFVLTLSPFLSLQVLFIFEWYKFVALVRTDLIAALLILMIL